MNIVIMGAPGSGKGTQSVRIIEKYNIPHISTGDMFREAMKNETEMGKKAKSFIDQGKLVPDDVTCGIVAERLSMDDCKNGFLLDGFPRTINQANELDNILKNLNKKVDVAINLEVPREVLIERLISRRICSQCGASYNLIFNPPKKENICDLCGGELYQRSDDNLESAETRLATYETETKPLIKYYKDKHVLHDINGYEDIDDVFNNIVNAIEG